MSSLIAVRDVWKTYTVGQQEVHALRGLTLNIDQGEYTALMGPSGSGKSTMMNILGCLDTPTAGKYHLNSQDVSEMSDNDLAEVRNREIGFIFQTFNLLQRSTALENVMLPLIYSGISKSERQNRAMEKLDEVQLSDRVKHKPNELSGGQRQRLSIARAVLKNSPVMIFDEATSSVDTETERAIQANLAGITKGKTALVIAHRLSTIRYADRILVLRDGQVAEEGHHDDLVAKNGTYADLWHIQSGDFGSH